MAAKKGGLGRGLDALFADNAVEELSSAPTTKLKLLEIEPNRGQPRQQFDEQALSQLADSIQKHGVIQPLLVRPLPDGGYQLVAGERRWRASRMAGLTEVPVVIREMTDADAMAITLVENLQREDLNPMEEATGLQMLMDSLQITQEAAAEAVGKSRPAIANTLRLLRLCPAVQALVQSGALSAGHARALLGFADETEQAEAAQLVVDKGLTVRQTEALARAAAKAEQVPQKKTATRRDPYFDEVELALSEALGRRTKVNTKKDAETGSLSIDFNSKEDLARITLALRQLEE